jgi:hypothetical protein
MHEFIKEGTNVMGAKVNTETDLPLSVWYAPSK